MHIVAISDQHGTLPDIEPCDVLLVAGDQCVDFGSPWIRQSGTAAEIHDLVAKPQVEWFFSVWLPWRHRQPAKHCVLTWGNHDYCGQIINRHESNVQLDATTHAIVDDLIRINGVSIWCTPWSSQFRDWAFMASENELTVRYRGIPADVDILMSHQPPFGLVDTNDQREHLGSQALLDTLAVKQPKTLVCGHIHGGHGHMRFKSSMQTPGFSIEVWNVALLNEQYQPVHVPTVVRYRESEPVAWSL